MRFLQTRSKLRGYQSLSRRSLVVAKDRKKPSATKNSEEPQMRILFNGGAVGSGLQLHNLQLVGLNELMISWIMRFLILPNQIELQY